MVIVVIVVATVVNLAAAWCAVRAALGSSAWRKKINEHSDELAVLNDSMEVIRGLAKRAQGRADKRLQRSTADGLPDPTTEPEAWLKAKQRELDQKRKH